MVEVFHRHLFTTHNQNLSRIYFILTPDDVERAKLPKRPFGEKKGYLAIRYYEYPETESEIENNKVMEKFIGNWEVLIK